MSNQIDEYKKTILEIRDLDKSISRIKLAETTLYKEKRIAVFDFICDNAVSDDTRNKIENYLDRKLPDYFLGITVRIKKIVADSELVKKYIVDYIERELLSISHSIDKDDITVRIDDGIVELILNFENDVFKYVEDNNIADKICEYLEGVFCDTFKWKLINKGKKTANSNILTVKINPVDIENINVRTFKVNDIVRLWGEEIECNATYIADCNLVSGTVVLAGRITSINQKLTKNNKPYYIIELDDTTGKMSCKVFLTKEKESKITKLNVGSNIIVRGDIEIFNERESLRIADLSYCEFPKHFVQIERQSRDVANEYFMVFPEVISESKQANFLYDEKPIPEALRGQSFVVVDIETTGINYSDGERITEIGAVKIEDGKITQKFQTLINPQKHISQEIIDLTGIDDLMVADAPTFDNVISDFYKFCFGCTIVAHNIEFDYNFIKYQANKLGYVFKNKGIDTLALSREVLPKLSNHKLNKVCEYFHIEFLHHRALSDAHATAKMFIELINIKKSLPD